MRPLLALLLGFLLISGIVGDEHWSILVDPDELADLQSRPTVVLDIRAPKEFAKGHIAGALNAPYGSWRGPADNPGQPLDDATLTERMQSLGLDSADRVVITYGGATATDFGAAARVYWTLKSAGLRRIAILNGGLAHWAGSGHALVVDPGTAERSTETFKLSTEWMVSRAEVERVVDGAARGVLVDARPRSFWRGRTKHKLATAPGTLPSALQLTHSSWFTRAPNQMSAAEVVKTIAVKAGYTEASDRDLISFCNTGHWAATNWFALSEIAGIDNVKLYPESVVGWSRAGGDLVPGQ